MTGRLKNNILWLSFYIAVALAWIGILAVDSASFLPAVLAGAALCYLSLFVAVNEEAFR